MDKNKHKLYMAQILSLIFKDKDLCNVMAFKGGTSLMFFHNLNPSPKLLMQGLGEVLNDTKSKTFVRSKLINETSSALELFSAFPLIVK